MMQPPAAGQFIVTLIGFIVTGFSNAAFLHRLEGLGYGGQWVNLSTQVVCIIGTNTNSSSWTTQYLCFSQFACIPRERNSLLLTCSYG